MRAHAFDFSGGAHIALAVLTSAVLLGAFVLAILLWLQTRRLHALSPKPSLLDRLPPVLSLEKKLFRTIGAGFVLLMVLIGSGMLFGEHVWGRALAFNHKVVLTLLAWLVFAVLLIGRYIYGWRGLVAVRATIIGFALLFLAYVGTHFVLDVILKR
ncbi:MAG: cytochrome C assembly family protein [Formosimonas sp.]